MVEMNIGKADTPTTWNSNYKVSAFIRKCAKRRRSKIWEQNNGNGQWNNNDKNLIENEEKDD